MSEQDRQLDKQRASLIARSAEALRSAVRSHGAHPPSQASAATHPPTSRAPSVIPHPPGRSIVPTASPASMSSHAQRHVPPREMAEDQTPDTLAANAPNPPPTGDAPAQGRQDAILGAEVATSLPTPESDAGARRTHLEALLNSVTHAAKKAVVHYEIGVLLEAQFQRGDEAAQHYLRSYNLNPAFRPPLDALIRMHEQRRSTTNLLRLYDAESKTAVDARTRTDALLDLLAVARTGAAAGSDVHAKQSQRAFQALQADASDNLALWVMEEAEARRLDDESRLDTALARQCRGLRDPEERGPVMVERAWRAVARGDVSRAERLLREAATGSFRLAGLLTLEQLLRAHGTLDALSGCLRDIAVTLQSWGDTQPPEHAFLSMPTSLVSTGNLLASSYWTETAFIERTQRQRPGKACEDFASAVALDPGNRWLLKEYLLTLELSGRFERAEVVAEQLHALESHPQKAAAALFLKSWAAEAANRPDAMQRALLAALDADPGSPTALAMLDDVLEEQGNAVPRVERLVSRAAGSEAKTASAMLWQAACIGRAHGFDAATLHNLYREARDKSGERHVIGRHWLSYCLETRDTEQLRAVVPLLLKDINDRDEQQAILMEASMVYQRALLAGPAAGDAVSNPHALSHGPPPLSRLSRQAGPVSRPPVSRAPASRAPASIDTERPAHAGGLTPARPLVVNAPFQWCVMDQALYAMQAGQYRGSARAWLQLAEGADHPALRAALATCAAWGFSQVGDHETVVSTLKQVMSWVPGHALALHALVDFRRGRGEADEVVALLYEGADKEVDDVRAQRSLLLAALAAEDAGDTARATDALERAAARGQRARTHSSAEASLASTGDRAAHRDEGNGRKSASQSLPSRPGAGPSLPSHPSTEPPVHDPPSDWVIHWLRRDLAMQSGRASQMEDATRSLAAWEHEQGLFGPFSFEATLADLRDETKAAPHERVRKSLEQKSLAGRRGPARGALSRVSEALPETGDASPDAKREQQVARRHACLREPKFQSEAALAMFLTPHSQQHPAGRIRSAGLLKQNSTDPTDHAVFVRDLILHHWLRSAGEAFSVTSIRSDDRSTSGASDKGQTMEAVNADTPSGPEVGLFRSAATSLLREAPDGVWKDLAMLDWASTAPRSTQDTATSSKRLGDIWIELGQGTTDVRVGNELTLHGIAVSMLGGHDPSPNRPSSTEASAKSLIESASDIDAHRATRSTSGTIKSNIPASGGERTDEEKPRNVSFRGAPWNPNFVASLLASDADTEATVLAMEQSLTPHASVASFVETLAARLHALALADGLGQASSRRDSTADSKVDSAADKQENAPDLPPHAHTPTAPDTQEARRPYREGKRGEHEAKRVEQNGEYRAALARALASIPETQAASIELSRWSIGAPETKSETHASPPSQVTHGSERDALHLLRACVADDPSDLSSWEALRVLARTRGAWTDLVVACDELAEALEGEQRFAMLEESGVVLMDMLDDRAAAAERFRTVLSEDLRRSVSGGRLYEILVEEQATQELLDLLRTRLAALDDPEEIQVLLYDQARLMRAESDLRGAAEALEHLFEYDAAHIGGVALAAEVEVARENWPDAVRWLVLLTQLDIPDEHRHKAHLGAADLLEHRLQQPAEALKQLIEASHAAPKPTTDLSWRIVDLAERAGMYAEAVEYLQKSIAESPGEIARQYERRLALLAHKSPEHHRLAEQLLLRCHETVPGDEEIAYALASRQQDPTHAAHVIEALEHAIRDHLVAAPCSGSALRALVRVARWRHDQGLVRRICDTLIVLGAADDREEELFRAQLSHWHPPTQATMARRESLLAASPLDVESPTRLFASLLDPYLAQHQGLSVDKGMQKERKRHRSPTARAVVDFAAVFGCADAEVYRAPQHHVSLSMGYDKHGSLAWVLGPHVRAPLTLADRFQVARWALLARLGALAWAQKPVDHQSALLRNLCLWFQGKEDQVEAMWRGPSAEIAAMLSWRDRRKAEAVAIQIEPRSRGIHEWANTHHTASLRAGLLAAGSLQIALQQHLGATVTRALIERSESGLDLLRFWTSNAPRILEQAEQQGSAQ